MKYYVKNDLSKILDSRYNTEGDRLIFRRAGKVQGDYLASDFTELEVSEEKWSYGLNKDLFKLVDGVPKVHTITYLQNRKVEKLKTQAIKDANLLYKELKNNRIINGYDLSDTFEFDYQRNKGGDVRVKLKDGKTEVKTKQDTDGLELALFTYLNSVANAFDSDMDLIEDGDYSLPNLNALVVD